MIKATAVNAAGPADVISTDRIELRCSRKVTATAVADFYLRNVAHFAPWDPPLPEGHLTVSYQAERLRMANDSFAAGAGFRYWLVQPGDRTRVVGSVHFSNVVRGPFQSCSLGYAIDGTLQGQGLMHTALQAAIAEMFSPRGALHRVQAGVRPENVRSLALMQRLGFERIGIAPRYLLIDGDWRDHVLFQRVNPDWRAA